MASKSTSSKKKTSSKSSTNKAVNKTVKAATKMAKKNPKGLAILVLVIFLVVGGGIGAFCVWWFFFRVDVHFELIGNSEEKIALNSTYVEKGATATYNGKDVTSEIVTTYYLNNEVKSSIATNEKVEYTVKYDLNYEKYSGSLERKVKIVEVEEIAINFMELGNKYTGDSTYIKAGDTDILIDAGSRNGSASTIASYVDQYCTDGKLEYVIATHAHQDHIAGFVGTNTAEGILKHYKIDTLIDFVYSNSESAVYKNYVSLRTEQLNNGNITHHYTAAECVAETSGAKKVYDLAAGITMEILDQKFYHEKTSDENDYSVCTLFTQGNNHYLLTGDLEKDGEASLVERNNLPEVELFKGGHHGSYTANTDTLLSVIKPKNVCICCCAGSTEYTTNMDNTFPAQAAINRIGKYTDKVYVTTVDSSNEQGYESMNGNIRFLCPDGINYTITGSNNSTILKDTDWFKNHRIWPTN